MTPLASEPPDTDAIAVNSTGTPSAPLAASASRIASRP